jgi:hypothetical protein
MIEDPSFIERAVDVWPVLVFVLVVAVGFPAAQRWYERQQERLRAHQRERTRAVLRRIRHVRF